MGTVYACLLLFVVMTSLFVSDREFRIVVWTLLLGSVLSALFYSLGGASWLDINPGVLAIDAFATLLFGTIAFTSRRFWPLWVAAFQFGALLSHLSSGLATESVSYAVGVLQGSWAWFQLLTLSIIAVQSFAGSSSRQI